jgi:putative ABC transport system substrate-binding protein
MTPFYGTHMVIGAALVPILAQELVRLRPDVVVAGPTSAALAMKQATSTIPLVCSGFTDPVGFGLVVSEARPGTNVTGILARVEGLPGKQLEIARDFLPGTNRIHVLINAANVGLEPQRREIVSAAEKLGIELQSVELRTADDIGPAFELLAREAAKVAVVLGDAMFIAKGRQIAAFALSARLPTVFSQ